MSKLSNAAKQRLDAIIGNTSKEVTSYGRTMYGVDDGVLLNILDKVGIIKNHYQTNTRVGVGWSGATVSCRYIDDVLVYKADGYCFSTHYVDGCFNPYLVVNRV